VEEDLAKKIEWIALEARVRPEKKPLLDGSKRLGGRRLDFGSPCFSR
jgi:hypothetical protein